MARTGTPLPTFERRAMKRPCARGLGRRRRGPAAPATPAREIAMKLRYALCLVLAPLLALAGLASADEFSPAQKQELGAFIKDYLVKNPDVLRAAIDALDKHDKQVAE